MAAIATAMAVLAGCGGRVVVDSVGQDDEDPGGTTTSSGTTGSTGGNTSFSWQSYEFDAAEYKIACYGERYVSFSQAYSKWVGVILCDANRYKIFLGESQEGKFFEIGDNSGHGQDHCELVNPAFTIPNDDDIKSGCSACDISTELAPPLVGEGYTRSQFGEPFTFETPVSPQSYTSTWYECGVAIP